MDSPLVRSRETKDFNAEMERIAKEIGPEGILVWTEKRETLRFGSLTGESSSEIACGVLQPGSPLAVELLERNKTFEVDVETRLLIAVDQEAGDRLRSLQGILLWLSPDMEALIRNTIGNPSLEFRVSRLEAKNPGIGGESGSGWLGWLKGRFGQVPLSLAALFLILLMLGHNAYLLHSLSKRIGAANGSSSGGSEVNSGGGTAEGNNDQSPSAPTAQEKIFEVSTALEDQRDQEADFDSLYEAHFSKLKTVDDVMDGLEKEAERQSLVLGLMKLEALRLDRTGGASLIGEMQDYGKMKSFFKDHLKDRSEASAMVAALGCEAYKVPGLPYQKLDRVKSAAFLVGDKKDCTGSGLKDAMTGLDQLIAFVKNPDGTN